MTENDNLEEDKIEKLKEEEKESESLSQFPEKKKREIFKCPHKNRKHYAKVSYFLLTLIRICASTVTTEEVEPRKLGYVITRRNCITPKVCARIAI